MRGDGGEGMRGGRRGRRDVRPAREAGRERRHHRADRGRDGREPGCERDAAEDRRLREPRERPHREPQAPERDAQERAHDARIELLAGAARDLVARIDGIARVLVRARRGDHVEDVGDRDDAAGERDAVAGGAVRIALAVPALVVVCDRVRPLAEPRAQRRGEAGAELGMAADQLPLRVRRAPGLVEDLGRHLELADVVQQRGPVEAVDVVAAEPELLRDHLRVGADALGVAARQPVVRAELGDEPEQALDGFGRRLVVVARAGTREALLEVVRPDGVLPWSTVTGASEPTAYAARGVPLISSSGPYRGPRSSCSMSCSSSPRTTADGLIAIRRALPADRERPGPRPWRDGGSLPARDRGSRPERPATRSNAPSVDTYRSHDRTGHCPSHMPPSSPHPIRPGSPAFDPRRDLHGSRSHPIGCTTRSTQSHGGT